MTIKEAFFNWILKTIMNSPTFNHFLNNKMTQFYENESLKIARIWGSKERVSLGENIHLNNVLMNTVSGNITIGNNTFLGHNVSLLTGTHNIHKKGLERQNDVPNCGRDIMIGESVWIASNAMIIGPCTIGDYSVIGANSYVTGDIEANAFYAGSPAKKIKQIRVDNAI